MPSNDNDKATNTAASGRPNKRGVTPPVSTATGVETPLNNPIAPAQGLLKKRRIMVMPPLARLPHHAPQKATPALKNPATVDVAKDKDTPTLMQLKGPPEVEMQQKATTEDTQTLLQLKDPQVFEIWQHCTPDAALTLLRLKDAPEIETLQHTTASSIASQLKDNNDYNSCVDWAVTAASAGGDVEYDLII
jgi:hypothetical protein